MRTVFRRKLRLSSRPHTRASGRCSSHRTSSSVERYNKTGPFSLSPTPESRRSHVGKRLGKGWALSRDLFRVSVGQCHPSIPDKRAILSIHVFTSISSCFPPSFLACTYHHHQPLLLCVGKAFVPVTNKNSRSPLSPP